MKIILHQKDFPYRNGGFSCTTRISGELSKNNSKKQCKNGLVNNKATCAVSF